MRRAERARDRGRRDVDRLAGGERAGHGVGALRLHAPDPHVRQQRLDRDGYAGDQRAAADAHENVGQRRRVLGELEAHRSLAGEHRRVVERVHQRHAVRHQLVEQRKRGGHVLGEPQLGARSANAVDRPRRSGLRHHHRRADVHHGGDLRDGDAVVASAHSDNPRVTLDGAQREQLRRDAPRLERPGPLEQLELQRDRNAEQRAHPRACHRRRSLDMADDGPRGSADIVDGEQVRHRRHATGTRTPATPARDERGNAWMPCPRSRNPRPPRDVTLLPSVGSPAGGARLATWPPSRPTMSGASWPR